MTGCISLLISELYRGIICNIFIILYLPEKVSYSAAFTGSTNGGHADRHFFMASADVNNDLNKFFNKLGLRAMPPAQLSGRGRRQAMPPG